MLVTHRLFAPILTFPRKRGKGHMVMQGSLHDGGKDERSPYRARPSWRIFSRNRIPLRVSLATLAPSLFCNRYLNSQ